MLSQHLSEKDVTDHECQYEVTAEASRAMQTANGPAIPNSVGFQPRLWHGHRAFQQPIIITLGFVTALVDTFSDSRRDAVIVNGSIPGAVQLAKLWRTQRTILPGIIIANSTAPKETNYPMKFNRRLSPWQKVESLIHSNTVSDLIQSKVLGRWLWEPWPVATSRGITIAIDWSFF